MADLKAASSALGVAAEELAAEFAPGVHRACRLIRSAVTDAGAAVELDLRQVGWKVDRAVHESVPAEAGGSRLFSHMTLEHLRPHLLLRGGMGALASRLEDDLLGFQPQNGQRTRA